MLKTDKIKKATIFRNLTDEQLAKLSARGEAREVKQGEAVFNEGTTGDEIFVLIEGRAQCTVRMERDTEQAPVHTVIEGEIFGEFALVAGHERSATVRASQDCLLFVLGRDAFQALAEEDPQLGYIVLRDLGEVLVERIIKTTQELRASLMF